MIIILKILKRKAHLSVLLLQLVHRLGVKVPQQVLVETVILAFIEHVAVAGTLAILLMVEVQLLPLGHLVFFLLLQVEHLLVVL